MVNHFLLSMALVSQTLGITLPQALESDVYLAPTTVTEGDRDVFQWRVLNSIRSQFMPPIKVGEDQAPDIDARAALIMDVNTQQILWQKNPDQPLPVASITKLLTALTWLNHQPPAGLDHVHTFAPEQDTPGGKELNVAHGKQLRAFDLLRSTIVGSDNDTALALVATTEMGESRFLDLMNQKARAIGMTHSTFADPTGLSKQDISTARDIAVLARAAFAQEEIRTPAGMREHVQETVDTKEHLRVLTTNKLLYDNDVQVIAGKTGFTYEAGYCVVVQARDPDSGRDVIVVVLGTQAEQARFDEAKKLIIWTQQQYDWN